jgi:biotin synthase
MPHAEEAVRFYSLPLFELLYAAHSTHRQFHSPQDVQRCFLFSIKTGRCPEDCGYCAQSAHHSSGVAREPLLSVQEVVDGVAAAKRRGAQRFCMDAAWRQAPEGAQFERVLQMAREVKAQRAGGLRDARNADPSAGARAEGRRIRRL